MLVEQTNKLLGELISRNTKLCDELSSLISQIQDKCSDQQIKDFQKSVFMNINHNAVIIAMRQLNAIETINTQLNLIAESTTDLQTKSRLQLLSSNIDLALTGLRNVNKVKH